MFATLFVCVGLQLLLVSAQPFFDYDPNSAIGPRFWPSLDVPGGGNQCGAGHQSGISVSLTNCDQYADYAFSAGNCTTDDLTFRLLPYLLQVVYDGDVCQAPSVIPPGDVNAWQALQLGIRTGSEHPLDGVYFDAEMQIILYTSGSVRYMALAIPLASITADPFFSEVTDLVDHWQAQADQTDSDCGLGSAEHPPSQHQRRLQQSIFDPFRLLASSTAGFYQYAGSLTFPPCSEFIDWHVLAEPLGVAPADVRALTELIVNYVDPDSCLPSSAAYEGKTARPVMPINGREVARVCPLSVSPEPTTRPTPLPSTIPPSLSPTLSTSTVIPSTSPRPTASTSISFISVGPTMAASTSVPSSLPPTKVPSPSAMPTASTTISFISIGPTIAASTSVPSSLPPTRSPSSSQPTLSGTAHASSIYPTFAESTAVPSSLSRTPESSTLPSLLVEVESQRSDMPSDVPSQQPAVTVSSAPTAAAIGENAEPASSSSTGGNVICPFSCLLISIIVYFL